jgi:hypothetical protein
MAPYVGVMKSMNIDDMHIVVEFMMNALREAEEAKRKAEDEYLAKKMAEIKIDPEVDELFDALQLTPEETSDERTRWILGFDSK